ncbi:MAG: hypothetical protein HYS40_04325 [Gemmatimonadetes bacterium]|nr:hypothetical protein [Gemmatimonadota bacterium]
MTATAAADGTDRSDFRTVLVAGTKTGVTTAGGVVAFLLLARLLPVGMFRQGVLTLVVLAAGTAVSFLPARWIAARRTEGIAGATAAGLWGTVVFMAIDIILLRPVKAYPWTWDAIGGGSSWWYLPIWWMLGTFLAWMGAIVTAGQSARGEPTVARMAGTVLIGTVIAVSIARFAGLSFTLPFEAGIGYTVILTLAGIVTLARKS